MTAVGLGQQRSQAVDSGFESLSCQIFLWFIPNIFRYPKLMKHSTEGFPYELFRYCETKKLTENRDITITLLSIKFFDPRIRDTLKGSPTKSFGTVRQKKSLTENRDTPSLPPPPPPPPLLSIKFFDTRNFVKHRRVTLRSFSALWDKNFSTENRDTFCIKYRNQWWNWCL